MFWLRTEEEWAVNAGECSNPRASLSPAPVAVEGVPPVGHSEHFLLKRNKNRLGLIQVRARVHSSPQFSELVFCLELCKELHVRKRTWCEVNPAKIPSPAPGGAGFAVLRTRVGGVFSSSNIDVEPSLTWGLSLTNVSQL